MLTQQVQDRAADTAAAVSGGSLVFGMTIAQINQYLQAVAFVVAVISGLCAARYYWKNSKK